ncbi:MAG: hypothetical protein KJ558_01470 [Gammaproteobacteria bacterium]|nr:hypothetical protein [Gammaproteobacteria bacterium]MBU1653506.1 hypothetical protein [Gammaproteobacteria bacterium]MBU1961854.1 hypothetical protein [Gammaproteobacteria bacterium]
MDVLRYTDCNPADIATLCQRYTIDLVVLEPGAEIPGSYFGPPEAGLVGHSLYIRPDTPIHSLLHEGCHFICMDQERRSALHTDAGGEYLEENGVCYLQILLAEHIGGMGRDRMMRDMDTWGYTFRLGSAQTWFEGDAEDAREWLLVHGLIDPAEEPVWRLRV